MFRWWAMFCAQCGNKLKENQNFCASCGYRVGSAVSQPEGRAQSVQDTPFATQQNVEAAVPGTQASVENAVWVLRASRKLAMISVIPCSVVFFRDRVVIAHQISVMQNLQSELIAQTAGKPDAASVMRLLSQHQDRYNHMEPAAILAEDPANMELAYPYMEEVTFKCYSDDRDFDDTFGTVKEGRLSFSLQSGQTIKLTHNQADDDTVKDMLSSLFGSKLKYKD